MEAHSPLRPLLRAGLAATFILSLTACGDDDEQTPAPIVTIDVSGNHSVRVGLTTSLGATTLNGSDTSYVWSSSDPTVATVDDAGVVTGVSEGETLISVLGAQTAASGKHAIVVVPATVTGGDPAITITGVFAIELNASTTLTAMTTNGSDASYTWSSDTPEVVSVDADGVATGNGVGSTVITATGDDTGASATFGITVTIDVPVYERWRRSGHADRTKEAFRHWDEEDPAEVPAVCAKCHASSGFADFVGADGSAAGSVDAAHEPSNGISCIACHTDAAIALSDVTFPSGVTIDGLGAEARCMTCHQGRGSTDQVDAAITTAAVGDDEVSSDLSFINNHYYAAGASLYAGQVRGGYQYPDQVYDYRFRHVAGRDTCMGCHDPHSLEIRKEACETCHGAFDAPQTIRMVTSREDYDGDGDRTEGIAEEIATLRDGKLLSAIQAYGVENGGAICYHPMNYPYFFQDTDGSGACEDGEAIFPNAYNAWTPRLLRAAYNYQVAKKDPAAFAHNAKYIIQLVYDSTIDLNAQLTNPVDMTGTARGDTGHFNGAGEAARHWDGDDEVSASCSKCHSGSEGYVFFLEHGIGTTVEEQANGLDCATCHQNTGDPDFAVRAVEDVVFPSGAVVDLQSHADDASSNVCGQCHSGRESGFSVDAVIAAAGVPNDMTASASLRFSNVHYKPAAGSIAGTASKIGYEYDGKTYAGGWTHVPGTACVTCHNPIANNHSFRAQDTMDNGGCNPCHAAFDDVHLIRGVQRQTVDYDGDGDRTEPLVDELATMAAQLLADMQAAATAAGTSVCYNPARYPYWFVDDDGNGTCEAAETSRYSAFTAQTLKAAYNYQYYQKEGGAWAHNFDYMGQLLYDTIEDLGGNTAGLVRP